MTHYQCEHCKHQITEGEPLKDTFKIICLAGGDIYASADKGERCYKKEKEGE